MMKSTVLSLVSICIFLFSSCSVSKTTVNGTYVANESEMTKSGLIHNVYFWYVEDADPKDITAFEKELETLGTISSIDKYYFGPPAATDARGVVDNSFDISINVFFKDIAAHDAYQIDPIHLAFIEKCKNLWEKVIVYDNELR